MYYSRRHDIWICLDVVVVVVVVVYSLSIHPLRVTSTRDIEIVKNGAKFVAVLTGKWYVSLC
jgi:hypothetical protein